MVAIFKPVLNGYGYDVREFEVKENGRPGKFRWLSVSNHMHLLGEVPILKPIARCESKDEFYAQFRQFI